ncbi:Hypothetical predicted protein [Pelobates cultripes]|uniref:Endonuclease/exonuclease/phosphatase domain-containing protein n=1 Tax=Pelobates cultripes TaxID=61616 RepID=A0AAD1WDW3_PELCU|nr:Hypothetical predicted protein [Pelobates cultripes]
MNARSTRLPLQPYNPPDQPAPHTPRSLQDGRQQNQGTIESAPAQSWPGHAWAIQLSLMTPDFAFYSHPHSSYSRIDMFLVCPSLLPHAMATSIGTIAWSDHADISLTLEVPQAARP